MLENLEIPTAGLKGTWLVLEADKALRVAAAQHRVYRLMQLRHQTQSTGAASSCVADYAALQGPGASTTTNSRGNEGVDEGPEVEVIQLGSSHRGAWPQPQWRCPRLPVIAHRNVCLDGAAVC